MDHATMIDEIKFLINKYVAQENNKLKEETIVAQKNMEALEHLPLVMMLRRRIRQLETELRLLKEGHNVYVKVEETNEEQKQKKIKISNSETNMQELDNIIVEDVSVIEDVSDKSTIAFHDDKDELVVDLDQEEENQNLTYTQDIAGLYGFKTASEKQMQQKEEEEEEVTVEEEEEEEEVTVEEEEEEEEVIVEGEEEEEEEEEEVTVEEEEEEEEEVTIEEEEEEEEVTVEEEEEEEEMEVIEHRINGKLYYVTSITNGEIYDTDDDEFENPIGKMVNNKAQFYKK